MRHWNCCSCLHTLHSKDRYSFLQWLHDKGRKDHRLYEVQAQLPNRDGGFSSVLRRLQYEVGPRTCGTLVVLRIPVKKLKSRDNYINNKHAYFVLSKNQILFS